MITINGERGFETVNTWEEITEIPGFKQKLNPEEHTLDQVIGRYIFKDYISCGLSNCRQPHGKGYIVTTKTNHVTNLGNVCGKTHFGIEFQEQSRIFDRDITDHNNREVLTTFLFQVDRNLELIESLRSKPKGSDWIYKNSRPLVERNKGCPELIVNKINDIVKNRNGSITTTREVTKNEAFNLATTQNHPFEKLQYIEEKIGFLKGIEALYPENNIRKILALDLVPKLSEISKLDIDSASSSELKQWVKWSADFDAKIKTLKEAISCGQSLLTKENLLQLLPIITERSEAQSFKKWVTNI